MKSRRDSQDQPSSAAKPVKRGSLRKSATAVHTWAGLVPSWILYFIFITGTAGYFNSEITQWMQPELPFVGKPPAQTQMLAMTQQRLAAVAAHADEWYIGFPDGRNSFINIEWEKHFTVAEREALLAEGLSEQEIEAKRGSLAGEEMLNPHTGLPVVLANGASKVRDTGGGNSLYRMHYVLHYLPDTLARWMVIICSVLMLVALVSGIVIHKQIFVDFFTFRPGKNQRAWLDMHNLFSVLSLPFQLMITYSGLLFFLSTVMPLLVFVPIAFTGIDVVDAMSAGSVEKMSPKNQALINIVSHEIFNLPEELEAAGEQAPLTAFQPLLGVANRRYPQQTVEYIAVDNAHDRNARVALHYPTEIASSTAKNLVFDGVTGEQIEKQSAIQGQQLTPSAIREADAVMRNLHEGHFAPPLLRWLYFVSGLMGAGMIATGAMLWLVKRRKKAEKTGQDHKGIALVACLNVATIAGLPAAIAVYFWGNRLLPVDMVNRAEWEMHLLFIAWGMLFLHAVIGCRMCRINHRTVWAQQLGFAALAYALLPLLNALTSSRHLANSLPQGDWMMAGFDLAVLAIGCGLAFAAYRVHTSFVLGVQKRPASPPDTKVKQPITCVE